MQTLRPHEQAKADKARLANTAGNTTMKRDDLYEVKIIKVNLEENHVIASWNGNKPRRYNEREIKKWRVKEPVPKGKDIFGGDRY